jgi:hypothetical protein
MNTVPRVLRTVVVGDDPFLCGEISSVLAKPGSYLPILDGPRVYRPDLEHEVLRRAKAIALVRPQNVLFAGLPETTCNLFDSYFLGTKRIDTAADLGDDKPLLKWSRSHVGLGVFTALTNKKRITFADDTESSGIAAGLDSTHVVLTWHVPIAFNWRGSSRP